MNTRMTKLLILLLALIATSCAAQYETIRAGDGAQFTPDNNNDDDLIINRLKPNANIEVIYEGKSVTAVPSGASFTVQPTVDTRDPNIAAREDCRNVGIVAANYVFASKDPVDVQRASDCSPLGTDSSYAEVGDYVIKLTVKDSAGATAEASMTLTVFSDIDGDGELDEGEEGLNNSSFRIEAQPLIAQVDESITFTAYCTNVNNKVISWNFADGSLGQSETLAHAYSKVGTYKVEANCTGDNNKKLEASLTIVVRDNSSTDTETDTDTKTTTDTDTSTDTDTNTSTDTSTDTQTDTSTSTSTDTDIDDDGKGGNPNQTPAQK